jgi:hypothetical protein
MAQKTLTKHERQVAVIVEQALNAMIDTHLTVAEIIDAAARSAQRGRNDATTLRWTRKTDYATTRFISAA